jgi:hypothetical protein
MSKKVEAMIALHSPIDGSYIHLLGSFCWLSQHLPMIFPIYEIDVGFSGFDLQLT